MELLYWQYVEVHRYFQIQAEICDFVMIWFIVLGQPERIAGIMDLLHDPDRRAGDHGE